MSEPTFKYEPDYDTKCENCDQVPTVTVIENGVLTHHTGLCGPCCWGEAETIDPETWN